MWGSAPEAKLEMLIYNRKCVRGREARRRRQGGLGEGTWARAVTAGILHPCGRLFTFLGPEAPDLRV